MNSSSREAQVMTPNATHNVIGLTSIFDANVFRGVLFDWCDVDGDYMYKLYTGKTLH